MPKPERLEPPFCIANKVMRIHRLTSGVFRKHLRPHGVSESQLSILFIAEGFGEIQQSALAARLHMEKSSMSRTLTRLFASGWVRRNAAGALTVTPKGRKAIQNIRPSWEAAMREIRDRLGDEGEDALSLVLERLT